MSSSCTVVLYYFNHFSRISPVEFPYYAPTHTPAATGSIQHRVLYCNIPNTLYRRAPGSRIIFIFLRAICYVVYDDVDRIVFYIHYSLFSILFCCFSHKHSFLHVISLFPILYKLLLFISSTEEKRGEQYRRD